MAPAHSRPLEPVPSGHILRLGIDLGTGKIQIDYQHIQGAATRHEAEIKPISLKDNQTACTAQIAILPAIGAVIYGTVAVENAIRADPALQDRVLELWKFALHSTSKKWLMFRKPCLHALTNRSIALQSRIS
jgi:hypothetical protein